MEVISRAYSSISVESVMARVVADRAQCVELAAQYGMVLGADGETLTVQEGARSRPEAGSSVCVAYPTWSKNTKKTQHNTKHRKATASRQYGPSLRQHCS